jgi:hypothetical protein
MIIILIFCFSRGGKVATTEAVTTSGFAGLGCGE